jgi:hypothetical protein
VRFEKAKKLKRSVRGRILSTDFAVTEHTAGIMFVPPNRERINKIKLDADIICTDFCTSF